MGDHVASAAHMCAVPHDPVQVRGCACMPRPARPSRIGPSSCDGGMVCLSTHAHLTEAGCSSGLASIPTPKKEPTCSPCVFLQLLPAYQFRPCTTLPSRRSPPPPAPGRPRPPRALLVPLSPITITTLTHSTAPPFHHSITCACLPQAAHAAAPWETPGHCRGRCQRQRAGRRGRLLFLVHHLACRLAAARQAHQAGQYLPRKGAGRGGAVLYCAVCSMVRCCSTCLTSLTSLRSGGTVRQPGR